MLTRDIRWFIPSIGSPSMRDENGLRRQWALLRALSARHPGLTLRQMAAELGVTERTIRRDLDVFRGVGFPLEEAVGEFGRKIWRIRGARDQPQLAFTFDEAIALHLGRRLLEPLAGTPFGEAARDAFQKIRAGLGPGALDYVDRFSAIFHQTGIFLHDYTSKFELIDTLRTAIEDGKEARMSYRSEGSAESRDRDVHPYGMIDHRGSLYLVAFAPTDGRIKHYKVDRVEAVEVGRAAFRRPEGFDLATYMAEAFGVYRGDGAPIEVTVRFGPEAARYVQESRWHGSQRLIPQGDGGVLAEFRVSGTEEIKRWIFSFGAKAVVLEPESLRREIAQELQALIAAYAPSEAGLGQQAQDAPESPIGGPRLSHPDRRRQRGRQATRRGS